MTSRIGIEHAHQRLVPEPQMWHVQHHCRTVTLQGKRLRHAAHTAA